MRTICKIFTVCIFLFLPFFAFSATQESFKEGRDYLSLSSSDATAELSPKATVSVMEFFSYGCPACFYLESTLNKWVTKKPSYVVFSRIPVEFESEWLVYAKTYYIVQALGKDHKITPAIFEAIHAQNKDLSSRQAMADFLTTQGVSERTFFEDYDAAPVVSKALLKGRQLADALLVFQVPGMIIDGKYKVDLSLTGADKARFFHIVNYLIAKEAKSKGLIPLKGPVV